MKISILFFFLSSFPSRITQKVRGIYERSAHQMNAHYYQRSSSSWLELHAACELRLTSYGPKHTLRWLSYAPFCAQLHTQLQIKGCINSCTNVHVERTKRRPRIVAAAINELLRNHK